jgi:hypothetical protein
MASSTEICNTALILIGQEPVITLDDTSKQARLCKRLYDSVLEAILRQYPWTFAIRRIILSRDLETPVFGKAYQYTLPTDCLRIIDICVTADDRDYISDSEYTVEGNKILTDYEPLYLRYISRPKSANLFDPQFCTCLAYRLARVMCQALTADQDLLVKLTELETQAIQLAQHTQAIEQSPQKVKEGQWIKSRW